MNTELQDATQFGREIARNTVANIQSVGLRIATAQAKQAKLTALGDIAGKAIRTAGDAQSHNGLTPDEVERWKRDAQAGFVAEMQASRAALKYEA